jgi:aminoglycoside phosphotransferase (APT) family kinase protein
MASRSAPPPVDYRSTAVRPGWGELPRALRKAIERRLGGRVAAVSHAGGGFTRGFAAVLTTGDGTRGFVKAADLAIQHHLADWYYHEIMVTRALPPAVPAPRPRWTVTAGGWYAVCFDAIDGAMPQLPWRTDELAATLDAWATTASALRAPPAALVALRLPRLADLLRYDLSCWQKAPPRRLAQVGQLATLEAALPRYADSAGLTHCDLRLDNVLVDGAGRAWICDWNWVCHGAPWFDTASLLISAYASGQDADRLFAEHPTTAGAPPDALDASLAALSGYLLSRAASAPSDASPAIRAHQLWTGEAALAWLAERRGWRW